MKIYYYKQQENTFALFSKKSTKLKRWALIGGLSLITAVTVSLWKVNHHGAAPLASNVVAPQTPQTQPAEQPNQLSLEEEAQATSLKIQNNIQQDEQILADSAKKEQQQIAAVNLKVDHQVQVITVQPKDNLGKIFSRTGISQKELHAVLKTSDDTKALKHLKPGQKIELTLNDHKLQHLSYVVDPTSTLMIDRVNDKFRSNLKTIPLEPKQALAKFVVLGSVSGSAKKAGLDSKRVAQLATIFKDSVNLSKGNHTGDVVSVLYQSYYLNGKKIKDGEIVAAEYKTATNTYQAVRFTDPKGNSGYYAPDGTSMQKRFLPAPLKFTRISSLFNPKRWHPVLHRFRHHEGVDYAAPYGTPIKSVASGTIAHLGRKGGYGNTIIIQHEGTYSTLYGHMQRYASNLKVGSHVQQGQLIGYVGSTGLATGPHLHFEFRINGVHRNPLTVALPNGKSITHAYRSKFHDTVKKLLAKLESHRHAADRG